MLAGIQPDITQPTNLIFYGLRRDGSTISQTFTTNDVWAFQEFKFSRYFGDITSLWWGASGTCAGECIPGQSIPGLQFDDITLGQAVLDLPGCGPSGGVPPKCNSDVSAVPLPTALPLLAAGLAGLGFIGDRKKKAA